MREMVIEVLSMIIIKFIDNKINIFFGDIVKYYIFVCSSGISEGSLPCASGRHSTFAVILMRNGKSFSVVPVIDD
jgi:hypothetical protein